MKITISLCVALVALTPVSAQIFRPEAVNGAVVGGIAGAVIGNNSGDLRHNAWKGAAIGAGAGLLVGEAVGNANASRRDSAGDASRGSGYIYRNGPSVRVGVGYGGYNRGYHGNGYYGSRYSYGYFPSYSYYSGYGDGYPYYGGYYPAGNAASNGLFLGALAGGIIGNNSGDFRHNGWRGAAWGAGAGWLLGSIVDANRRATVYNSAPVMVQQVPAVQAQPATQQTAAQPVTIINNYYNTSTPMSSANGMFGR